MIVLFIMGIGDEGILLGFWAGNARGLNKGFGSLCGYDVGVLIGLKSAVFCFLKQFFHFLLMIAEPFHEQCLWIGRKKQHRFFSWRFHIGAYQCTLNYFVTLCSSLEGRSCAFNYDNFFKNKEYQ